MTYQEKLDLAHSYLENKEKYIDFRPLFSRIYPFSTENLTGYFDENLVKDKNVLLTGSSCDQVLASQLYGAKSITHFDINPFVEFMYDLKKGAIKELNSWEFLNYFYYNSENYESFRYKSYEKIRNSLEGNSLDFWDTLYNNYSPLRIRRRLFILNNEEELKKYTYILPFMFADEYEKLQKKEFVPVEFISSNILDLGDNLEKKYDLLYFSNIFGREEMIDFFNYGYVDNIATFMKKILRHTERDGQILLNYFYSTKASDFYNKDNEILNTYINYVIDLFNVRNNISYKEIPSIDDESRDTILIYTKKSKKK